jgi:hypothetical protein
MQARGSSAKAGWLQEGIIRSHMLGKAMLPGDEELGKKDDDHRFVPARRTGWSIWNHTFRWRRRRILLAVAGLGLMYLLLSSYGGGSATDLMGNPIVPDYVNDHTSDDPGEPTGPPAGLRAARGTTPHTFDGQIRFYHLARTLRKAVHETNGYDKTNQNVLFGMASLQSASTLLPMICDMSKWSRNHVHVAFFGRDDMPIETLLEINGVDLEKCPATWHDARPDYTEYSSDARAQSAVTGAMSHINSFLHPQVTIMDDSLSEEAFFVRGMRKKTEVYGMPLIEVPKNKLDNFMWITRLDAGSLKNWHAPSVDIMIQVPSESSSVLRLLQSIKDADYHGLKPPRLILELPAQLDESVKKHVEEMKWPPHDAHPLSSSSLVVKRRITSHRSMQEEAAIRFLELFYPTSTKNSHVLLLSPQAQLSPLYFHYVHYALLEYKFSSFGAFDEVNRLMGVSLELPPVLLDGKTQLKMPALSDMHTDRYSKLYPKTSSSPFLWQAPNSHATLFFGDKWAELHSFLGNRVIKHHESTKTVSRAKLVSEGLPAWTEYMLEFMRARSYTLLYPAKSADALVTIHNELYHAPEEFAPPADSKDAPSASLNEPFLRAETPPKTPQNPEPPTIPSSQPLHRALPFDGDLPELQHLPYLLYDGTLTNYGAAASTAHDYADTFRKDVGGCTIPSGKHRKMVPGDARDLFCFGDDEWVSDGDVEALAKAKMVMDEEEETGVVPTAPVEEATSTKVRKLARETGLKEVHD